MKSAVELEVKCQDLLKDNGYVYALKARRKKIALVSFEALNNSASEVRLDLQASKLVQGNQSYNVERRETIIRKLSEFTWDFLVYLILDFHPILAAVDILFLLGGPLYNRRLRRQLRSLTDGEVVLKPGETRKGILGFRKVSGGAGKLQLLYSFAGTEKQCVECDIG